MEVEALACDLKRMEARAFHMAEWSEPVLRRYHAWVAAAGLYRSDPCLERLYPWLFVPPTLWPFHVHDVMGGCLAALEAGRRPTPRLCLLVDLLPEPPEEAVCAVVADHERQVQAGAYEHLLTAPAKYRQKEHAVKNDPGLRADWARIKAAFAVADFQDAKGVLRRTMATERNLRENFSVHPRKSRALFRAAFDAFCLRYGLYGMRGDDPLPLKLAVNVTPFGTLVFLPAYWSFDPKRDLRWAAIARLHRLRVGARQGAALAAGKAERRWLARRLHALDSQVHRRGLRGAARHRFLCAGLGWVEATSPRRITRLRAEFGG